MTDDPQEQATIDWAAAEVDGGVLHVPFAGSPSKRWAERVGAVLDRLQGEGRRGPWESLDVSKDGLEVTGIEPGTEDDVRYALEAAITQANADLAPRGDDGETGDTADREMTAAFRAFAND
jgi:hypothetical protein